MGCMRRNGKSVTFFAGASDLERKLAESSRHVSTTPFLVADTQLYKRLCPSVGWLVGRSVRGHESKSEEMSVLEHF